MQTRKIVLIAIVAFLFVGIIICFYPAIYEQYIILFHKNAVIKHVNSEGKLDGRWTSYVQGRIYVDANFSNGKREGWNRKFYKNGQIKHEVIYQNDLMNGIEKEYYENGAINYVVKWINNKMVGEEFHYLSDKSLNNYDVFDDGDAFLVAEYDSRENLKKVIGGVISPNIYVSDSTQDTLRPVKNLQHYHNIRDLSFIVANPPKLQRNIHLSINGNERKDFTVNGCTLILTDAFKKSGAYSINVIGKLLNDRESIVKADTITYTIYKE